MKSILKSILTITIAIALFDALAYASTVCDQGMPGRSGPWPVYLITPSQLLSKSNATTSVTPGAVAGHTVFSQSITQSGAITGQACGVDLPSGFDSVTFVATCVPSGGSVTLYIYNTTAVSATPTSGNYQTVTF